MEDLIEYINGRIATIQKELEVKHNNIGYYLTREAKIEELELILQRIAHM